MTLGDVRQTRSRRTTAPPRTSLGRSSQRSPTAERRPRPPDLRRSGSYVFPPPPRGQTGRDSGVRKAPRFLPSLAFRSSGGLAKPPSAVVRIGSRRPRAEAGRHRALGAWGCRVGSDHPHPTELPSPLLLSATRVVLTGRVSRRAISPRERHAVRTAVRAHKAGREPGGPVSTVGTYSSSWSLPSNNRLATISRVTSGYPS